MVNDVNAVSVLSVLLVLAAAFSGTLAGALVTGMIAQRRGAPSSPWFVRGAPAPASIEAPPPQALPTASDSARREGLHQVFEQRADGPLLRYSGSDEDAAHTIWTQMDRHGVPNAHVWTKDGQTHGVRTARSD